MDCRTHGTTHQARWLIHRCEKVKGFCLFVYLFVSPSNWDLKELQLGTKSRRNFIYDFPCNVSYINELVACIIEMQTNM